MKRETSIKLRPFMEDDYIIINKWRNDPLLQRYTVGPIRFVSLGIEKEWVRSKMMDNQKDIYWGIVTNDNEERLIGYTSLNSIDHVNKRAEWGGIVIGDKEYQDGRSVFEATVMVHEYAFEQLNLNRLYGSHLPEHPFTPTFSAAIGWKLEGVERQSVYKNGCYKDVNLCSMLRQDYDELKAKGEYNLTCIIKKFTHLLKDGLKSQTTTL